MVEWASCFLLIMLCLFEKRQYLYLEVCFEQERLDDREKDTQ